MRKLWLYTLAALWFSMVVGFGLAAGGLGFYGWIKFIAGAFV